jgi:hypothetical protein
VIARRYATCTAGKIDQTIAWSEIERMSQALELS